MTVIQTPGNPQLVTNNHGLFLFTKKIQGGTSQLPLLAEFACYPTPSQGIPGETQYYKADRGQQQKDIKIKD